MICENIRDIINPKGVQYFMYGDVLCTFLGKRLIYKLVRFHAMKSHC